MLTGGGCARWKTVLGLLVALDELILLDPDAVVTEVARVLLKGNSPSDNSSGVDTSSTDDARVLVKESMELADLGLEVSELAM